VTSALAPATQAARAQPARRLLPFALGSRFFVALSVGFVWTIPAWWSPRFIGVMFLWDAVVLAAWLMDYWRLPSPAQLSARRIWTAPLSQAQPGSATIEIENTGGIPIHASLIDELPPALRDSPPAFEIDVRAGASANEQYAVMPRTRGDNTAGRLFLRYRSPLGLAERWATANLTQTVRVLPDLAQARDYVLYLIRSRQVEMEKRRRRQRGQGRDFESLREYRPGDEQRDICWTATARRNQLTTRVYQVERSQTVWIVLDAGRLLRTEVRLAGVEKDGFAKEKLDYAVDAALSLAHVASQSGDRVGLLAYGRSIQQLIGGGRGPLHLRALVDALAQVRGEASEANHARAVSALLRRQSRRSLVVWLTDFAETATMPEVIEYAIHMTKRHLVVFAAIGQPDLTELANAVPRNVGEMYRHAAAIEVVERRRRLFRGLRDRGVLVVDIDAAGLAGALVNRYLEVKDRNLI
jgi:uncharacterized protein (DUF58 family)